MFSFFRYNSFIKPQPGTKRAPVIEWFSAPCFDFCSAMSGLLNVSSLLYSTYWFSVLNTGILLFCCRSSFDFSDKINNAVYFNSFSKLLLILDFNCETRECIFQSGQRSGNKLKLIACNLKDIAYDACMRFFNFKKNLFVGCSQALMAQLQIFQTPAKELIQQLFPLNQVLNHSDGIICLCF